jgi:hypothetical protein
MQGREPQVGLRGILYLMINLSISHARMGTRVRSLPTSMRWMPLWRSPFKEAILLLVWIAVGLERARQVLNECWNEWRLCSEGVAR